MENKAPFGFQHLEHPQAWLCATLLEREASTGLSRQWHLIVPPEKLGLPFRTPLSIKGCNEGAMAYWWKWGKGVLFCHKVNTGAEVHGQMTTYRSLKRFGGEMSVVSERWIVAIELDMMAVFLVFYSLLKTR